MAWNRSARLRRDVAYAFLRRSSTICFSSWYRSLSWQACLLLRESHSPQIDTNENLVTYPLSVLANAQSNMLLVSGKKLLPILETMAANPLPTAMTPELETALALSAEFAKSANLVKSYGLAAIYLVSSRSLLRSIAHAFPSAQLVCWCIGFLLLFVPTATLVCLALRKVLQNSTVGAAPSAAPAAISTHGPVVHNVTVNRSKKRMRDARRSSNTLHRLLIAFICRESNFVFLCES